MNNFKKIVTGPNCLQRFDPTKPSIFITDVINKGLGYILIQTDEKIESSENANAINNMVAKYTVKKMPNGKLICWGS